MLDNVLLKIDRLIGGFHQWYRERYHRNIDRAVTKELKQKLINKDKKCI